MSTELGSLHWVIDGDDTGFREKIESSKNALSGFQDRLKSAQAGSAVFTGGVLAAGAAIGGMTLKAINSAGEMEMLRSSLDVLTGSAEQGTKVFQDLNKFAASTPFETGDLANATKTMLSFGISSKQVMGNLQMLGDVSLGNKDKLAGLTLAFSQVQSQGKLMGQDLLQMINNGFNPLQQLSQNTGKSMSKLKEEMAAGKITAEDVAQAFEDATREGGLFFKGMERGATTLPGLWSTFMDVIGMTTRELVGLSETGDIIEGGLFEKVKNGLASTIEFLTANKEALIASLHATFGWIKDNFPIIAGFIFGGMIPAILGAAGAMWTLMAPLAPFVVAGAAIGFLIQQLSSHFGGWQGMIEAARGALSFLDPVVGIIKAQLLGLWGVVQNNLLPALREWWNVMSPILIPALKVIGAIVGVTIVAAISLLIAGVQSVIFIFSKMIEKVNEVVGAIKTMVAKFVDVPNLINGAMEKAKGMLDKLNPFHRESPSLIDNIRKGVGIISKEFESLNTSGALSFSMPMPDIDRMNSAAMKTQTGSSASNVVINNENNFSRETDVDAFSRKLAFQVAAV